MAPTNDDCLVLDQGDIRFYDNYVPALEVGDYLINVTQQINPVGTTIDECYAASQAFSVQGPRYTLPTADVFSVFPPNNAQGVFDQFLPHVVLSQRELPWERNVFNDTNTAQQTPWMALLLFVEGEQIGGQPALLSPNASKQVFARTMSATIPATDLYATSPPSGVQLPALESEWYETSDFLASTLCSVIDLSPKAFATLIPPKADLPFLAHARQVNPTAKDNSVLKISGAGWYSVIVGNRLADPPPAGSGKPGTRNIVHLVSLEGWQDFITGTKKFPDGTTRVRMISLQSWTFTCLPELGESFSELMNGLLTDSDGMPKSTALTLAATLPQYPTSQDSYAYQALQNGYVPLRYQTRLGEQTFAWYRGPFSPVPVTNFISAMQQTAGASTGWVPFPTASAAAIYDKTYGVFDVSYSVAWETGRLMALAAPHFGRQLLDWGRNGHRLIDLIMERKYQIAALQNFDPDNPDPTIEASLLDQLQPYAVTDDFMTYLITQFTTQIAPRLSGQPSDTSDPPFPPFPDMPTPPTNPTPIADLLQESDVQDAVRALGGAEMDSIVDWLAQLYLLVGVPFENLIPNASMLLPESVRFFYLDSNSLDSMVEGALSIGIESSRDRMYQDLMKDLIWNTTHVAIQQVRDNLLGSLAGYVPVGTSVPLDQESLTGLLLRSAVVAGWPGLECNAYASYTIKDGIVVPDISSQIPLLRMERLSSEVLLCLWPTVPAVITMDEPHEGVAFGFEDPPTGEGDFLYLRSLDSQNYGTPLCTDAEIESGSCKYTIDAVGTGLIDPVTRIVAIGGTRGLLAAMQAALPNTPTLQIRDFAIQMVRVPEQAIFATPLAPGKATS